MLPRTGTGEAMTRLALLTAWTERVRVGTAILLLPLYQPVIAAKQLADLDAWSGGRVSVGVGVGGEFPHEFDAVGVPVRERGARTDEAMQVMRALWQGDPVTFHGRFTDLDEAQLVPVAPRDGRSGQAGGPPFLVSGRKIPRDGGIILALAESREAIEHIARRDPFVARGLADFRVIEFRASQRAEDLAERLGRA